MATSALEAELGRRRRPRRRPLPQFPTELLNEPPAPGVPQSPSFGLRNIGGAPDPIVDAYRAAQERAQTIALNPQLAGARNWSQMADAQTYTPSLAESWKNAIPTGPQFPAWFGAPDPTAGPTTGGWDDYVGNIPRAAVNMIPQFAGEALARTGREIAGIAGVPASVWHAATTPEGQLQREAAAEKERQANVTPGAKAPLVDVRQQLPPSADETAAITAAGYPELTAQQASYGITPQGAGVGMPTAGGGHVGPLPPAALAMAQQFQAMGYTPLEISGLLAQASAESNFQPGAVGDSGTSVGFFQHHLERAAARAQYARERGLDPNDPYTEAKFANFELRGEIDPNTGQRVGGTEGYAWQQLQEATNPYEAAAAGLHFERPSGYSRAPGQFNPQAVAGWGNRLNSATEYYNALQSGALPPVQETPPAIPTPIDQPTPVAPDYSGMNYWLNKATPQAPDAAAQRQMEFNTLLASIAEANANADPRGPGGTGRLIAALGAGAATGRASGQERARVENENFKIAQEGYARMRAPFAQAESNAQTEFRNRAQDVGFSNQTRGQEAKYLQSKQDYETRQARSTNIYNWQKEAETAGRPVLKPAKGGLWRMYPDGSAEFIPDGTSGGRDMYQMLDTIGKIKGPGGEMAKYIPLFQAKSVPLIRQEIMNDVFAHGLGQAVFQQNYTNALAAAEEEIKKSNFNLKTMQPAKYQELLDRTVKGKLQAQFANDNTWIDVAAANGVWGATAWKASQSGQK